MHTYRSKKPIFWLRLCAVLYPLLMAALILQMILCSYALIGQSRELMIQALYGMGGLALLGMFYGISAANSKCPLCRNGPMSSKRCSKHKLARTVLGSYRMAVVASVLFLNRFRCPYCGESTQLKVKEK